MTPDQMAQLLSALKDIYHSRLLSACGLTLAVYDWALVLPDEIETIIQARWTVPKALYYYIRVITPLGLLLCTYQLSDLRPALTDRFCSIWAGLQVFGMLSSLVAANGLLTLRLIALYRRNQAVVWFIRCFFAASYAVTLGIAIDSLIKYHDNLFYSFPLRVCGTHASPKSFPAIFYAPAAFEFFVFALTAWRGWQDAKVITGTGAGSAPFLMVLYRDGFICFFVMVALRIWNIWILLTQPLSSFNLGTQLMWAVNTILTTRVYMNLVWLAKKPIIESTNLGSRVPAGTGTSFGVSNLGGTFNVGGTFGGTGGGGGGGIPMRVHTFSEVHTDDWKRHQQDTYLDTVDEGGYRGRF